MSEKVHDITIIGGGPVGLFTAFYGGMRQASVNIIESLPHLGGQLTALYPEKFIYDVAGFPKVRAQELVDSLTEQAMAFDPDVTLGEAVQTVERQEDGSFKLTTNKDVHYTKTIIITAGNGAFEPRKLKIKDIERFEETNLHYHVNNMERFRDRNVMICGGGDSAVDWSLMLEPIAKQVTLVHRRAAFRAHEHSVEQLENSSVRTMTPYTPEKLIGDETINQVVLKEVKGEDEETIDIDDLIVNYGFISSLADQGMGARHRKEQYRRQPEDGDEYRRHLCSRRHLYVSGESETDRLRIRRRAYSCQQCEELYRSDCTCPAETLYQYVRVSMYKATRENLTE